MLEIHSLTKRFGPLSVLKGIDLVVAPERVLALVGPNGAGKTTLIKSVLGLTRPDGGTIALDGAPAADDACRARIGYMPQVARFPENLSARELIAMLVDLRGADVERDEALIDAFALAPHLDKPLRALSGGTRQKVNAVLAFLFRPALLVLDEPTSGLDPVASGILKDKVRAERDAGRAVLLTSHVMSEIEELADDVAYLVDGSVAYAGPIADLLQETGHARLERAVAHLMTRRAA